MLSDIGVPRPTPDQALWFQAGSSHIDDYVGTRLSVRRVLLQLSTDRPDSYVPSMDD